MLAKVVCFVTFTTDQNKEYTCAFVKEYRQVVPGPYTVTQGAHGDTQVESAVLRTHLYELPTTTSPFGFGKYTLYDLTSDIHYPPVVHFVKAWGIAESTGRDYHFLNPYMSMRE